MIEQVNAVRAGQGLPALRRSAPLERSARRFSDTLMSEGIFGHQRVSASPRFRHLAEALAMHPGRQPRVRATVATWLRSPVHRQIVLSQSVRCLGAGMTQGRFHGRQAVIWVLQAGSAPAG